MARGKWISKKSATNFTLVHRPQNDPLIHDESAPQMVLRPLGKSSKSRNLDDLASEIGSECGSIRNNEGEAASYGIYYDDSEYDYMQHLRDPGDGGGNVVFLPATGAQNDKGKKKAQPLEEALRRMNMEQGPETLKMDEALMPSKNLQKLSLDRQQDVPDYIAGFQPDMDPRLREVLEALEDDAFVDDNDDVFQELAKAPEEISAYEFEDAYFYDEEDDGWESDRTARPHGDSQKLDEADGDDDDEADADDGHGKGKPVTVEDEAKGEKGGSEDWMQQFKQFKRDQEVGRKPILRTRSEFQPSLLSVSSTGGGRRKKRKGALTSASTYSMTSSSIVRTEHMTILDGRFEKIDEEYQRDKDEGDEDDMKSMSAVSAVSGLSAISAISSVQGPVRNDFDGILDDFLNTTSQQKVARGKKHGRLHPHNGLSQLDEVRRELGPARIKSRG